MQVIGTIDGNLNHPKPEESVDQHSRKTKTTTPFIVGVFTVCFEFRVEFYVVVTKLFFRIIMIAISIFHSVGMCLSLAWAAYSSRLTNKRYDRMHGTIYI